MKCIVPCDWKEGRSYRALIQEGRTSSGDTTLEFWLYDLLSGTWTKLVEYDTGIPDAYMCKACAFLENFDEDYARDVRSAELWNFRARSVKTGKWVGAKTATMEQCYDYPGSYNYGSTGNVFWAVTTGVPGKCKKPPQSKKYKVTACETGSPY